MRLLGVVAGVVGLAVVAVLAIAAVLSLSNDTAWTDLDAGDCFDLAAAIEDADGDVASVTAVETIDCSEAHDAQVVAIGELDPNGEREYPDDPELFDETDEACRALVPDSVDPRRFGIVPIAPDERTWADRAGRFTCVAVVVGGGTVTGSALD